MISTIPKHSCCLTTLMAGNGDCVLISYGDKSNGKSNILIDGGNNFCEYSEHIQPVLEEVVNMGQKLDLVVITHIDQDHIKGIIYLTRDLKKLGYTIQPMHIESYWFNSSFNKRVHQLSPSSADISAAEMEEFEKFLHNQPESKWDITEKIEFPLVKTINGATFSILSPDREILAGFMEAYNPKDIGAESTDYRHSIEKLFRAEIIRVEKDDEGLDDKLSNASSIAFLFEYQDIAILYLGDAIPAVIEPAIEKLLVDRRQKRLKVNVVKLSHHGSRKSLSYKMVGLIDCRNYLICANGKKANLPNKATFAKILCHPKRDKREQVRFYSNYPDFSRRLNFSEQEKINLNFSCSDANFPHGYHLTLPIEP